MHPQAGVVCLAGKHACPPEYSESLLGFHYPFEAASNPEYPDDEEYKEYLDPDWDAGNFNAEVVMRFFGHHSLQG